MYLPNRFDFMNDKTRSFYEKSRDHPTKQKKSIDVLGYDEGIRYKYMNFKNMDEENDFIYERNDDNQISQFKSGGKIIITNIFILKISIINLCIYK